MTNSHLIRTFINLAGITVDSSNIYRIAYFQDGASLFIEFQSGGLYSYKGVPYSIYGEFLAAESHGRFFNRHIKNNYDSERLLD